MNTTLPSKLLEQIAQIQRMEPGKLCVIRQGPDGAYYSLQCHEHGKNVTQYIPRDQQEAVAEHTANYRKFRTLVDAYAEQIIDQTRRERREGAKKRKKTLPKPLPGHRMRNSKN